MMYARMYSPRFLISRQTALATDGRLGRAAVSVSATSKASWNGSWGGSSRENTEDTRPVKGVWGSDEEPSDRRPRGGRGNSRRDFERNSGDQERQWRGRGENRSSFRGSSGRGGRFSAAGRFRERSGAGNPFAERWAVQEEGHREIKDARAGLNGSVQLYGVAPVLAALKAQRREMHTVYIQDSMDMKNRKDAAALHTIRDTASKLDLPITYLSKHILNTLADNRPHQGILLDCGELPYSAMEVLPSVSELAQHATPGAAPPVWLVIDEVSDPQNLGAMVRSSMFLGAAGILAASKNCAPMSPAASKASAGCLEAFQIHDCDNLPRTLAQASEDGWCIVGAGAANDAVECSDIKVARPTLLVLGNEGSGLRTNVKRVCETFVKVSSAEGLDGAVVDSLNVSVATGVLLHTMLTSARSSAESWRAAV